VRLACARDGAYLPRDASRSAGDAEREASMTPITLFLAKLIGAFSLVMTAWLILRKDVARGFVDAIINSPNATTIVGMVRLACGLAIILGHDAWDSGFAIFVSLLGWAIFLSGIFTLLAPHETVRAVFEKMQFGERYYVFALVSFVIGSALLIGGFTG
jgi:hypothetical protein